MAKQEVRDRQTNKLKKQIISTAFQSGLSASLTEFLGAPAPSRFPPEETKVF